MIMCDFSKISIHEKNILKDGDLGFDLKKKLGVWLDGKFNEVGGGMSQYNGVLDTFGRIHENGIYNISNATTEKPHQNETLNGFALFFKRSVSGDSVEDETTRTNINEMQIMCSTDNRVWVRVVNGLDANTLLKGNWVQIVGSSFATLDTPYYTLKMQQEGIYEDYINYRDELHEYEKLQRELETQRQLAFEQRENQEQSYEEWLSEQAEVIPLIEPQPSERLIDFKNRYLG